MRRHSPSRRVPAVVRAAVLALLVLAFAFAHGTSQSEARSLSDDPTLLSQNVSAGYYHTCGLRTDGTLACWGSDNFGQATAPAGTFTQVSAGQWYTCGVRTDGTLACWGYDAYRQATPPTDSYVVDSTDDGADSEPGNGVCDDGSGNCTLRGARHALSFATGRTPCPAPLQATEQRRITSRATLE